MPLNYADVELLNRSMENAGNAFAQRRAQQNQEQRDISQELIRRKMLDVEQQRARATGEHEQRMESQFTTRAAQQDKQDMLKTVLNLNAGGMLDDEDIKRFNDWLENDPDLSKTGIHIKAPPQKAPPQVGQNSVAAALEQAAKYRAAGNIEYAEILEKSARKASEDYDTVTEEFPAEPGTPGTPAESHFFGSDTPATPGTPGTPKRTITHRVPAGTRPAESTAKEDRVMVEKDGKKYTVPRSQLEDAKQQGYTEVK